MRSALVTLFAMGLLACRPSSPSGPTLQPTFEQRDADLEQRDAALDHPVIDSATPRADAGATVDGGRYARTSSEVPQSRISTDVIFHVADSVFPPGHVGASARADVRFAAPTSRSGRAPSIGATLDALTSQLASAARFRAVGGFNALGDGRFVAIVRRTDRQTGALAALVVVASELDGRAQLESATEIPTEFATESEATCPLTIRGRELRDLDLDGEPELALAVSYCGPQTCPLGYTIQEWLVVLDFTPTPSISLIVERHFSGDATERGRRQLRTRWSDVNHDGHPDMVVDGEDCGMISWSGDGPDTRTAAELGCDRRTADPRDNAFEDAPVWCCVRRHEVALYDAQSDRWTEVNAGATLLEREPCASGEE